LTRVSRNPW